MSLRRLRTGELLVAAGALTLLVVLFLDWFEAAVNRRVTETSGRFVEPALHTSGWSAVGWVLLVLLAAVLVLAGWLVVATATDAPVSRQMAASVLTASAGAIVLVVLTVRVTIAQPGLGAGLPDAAVAVRLPAYLGLAALAVLVAGAWRAIADERTGAPESAYTPPPARPAPPERV
ncbi:MAG: hypothetical protein QOJ22_1020 [Thermoleophilaceae bacterium]|nr:hypothetical protein [Thermoleophilaceae bacterium]